MRGKSYKSIKVSYANVPNMGDVLNVLVIEDLFGFKVIRRTHHTSELSAIGSGLGQYTYHGAMVSRLIQRLYGMLFPSVYVWGTGFICNKEVDTPFYRKRIKFAAFRGELSKMRVEKILGHELDIPMGDAGLLSSFLLKTPIAKKNRVGIISHYKELEEPFWKDLLKSYDNSTFIDVRQDPAIVIAKIAECDYIISSSLHGLIIADSFCIPNIHIVVTDKLSGDGFKFDDYYSAYGLKHSYLDMNKDPFPTLEWIKGNYKLNREIIEKKQLELIKAFPFKNETAPINSMINQ